MIMKFLHLLLIKIKNNNSKIVCLVGIKLIKIWIKGNQVKFIFIYFNVYMYILIIIL